MHRRPETLRPSPRVLSRTRCCYRTGGGKRPAALVPIQGADNICRLLEAVGRNAPPGEFRTRETQINGMPGFIIREPSGGLMTVALDIGAGKITAIYVVRNPDKLRGVSF